MMGSCPLRLMRYMWLTSHVNVNESENSTKLPSHHKRLKFPHA
jgi:hypothetical protein